MSLNCTKEPQTTKGEGGSCPVHHDLLAWLPRSSWCNPGDSARWTFFDRGQQGSSYVLMHFPNDFQLFYFLCCSHSCNWNPCLSLLRKDSQTRVCISAIYLLWNTSHSSTLGIHPWIHPWYMDETESSCSDALLLSLGARFFFNFRCCHLIRTGIWYSFALQQWKVSRYIDSWHAEPAGFFLTEKSIISLLFFFKILLMCHIYSSIHSHCVCDLRYMYKGRTL